MSKQKTQTTPKLRFPEFQNTGDWEEKIINNIADLKKGSQLNKIELTNTDKYPVINGGINPSGYTNKWNTKKNTITISEGGNSCGYINFIISRFWSGGHCYSVEGLKKNVLNKFLFQFLKFNENSIMRLRVGSGLPNIQKQAINNFKVNLPNIKEQQKIADCLSSLDNLITTQTKKLTVLQTHKKGLMQNLFPAEGKTTPKLRFPEFQNSSEWEIKQLGDLCKIAKSGGTPTSTNKEYYDGNIPFLAISDMTKQGKYLTHTSKKISQNGIDNSASWIVPINTLIYSMYASVGFVSINKIPLATSQAVINLRLKDNLKTNFIYYYLLNYKQYINKYIETGTQGNLNGEIVKSLQINLPLLKEQQKIADCLSSLDNLITTQTQKLTALQTHKKGLMQNLFPNNEALE